MATSEQPDFVPGAILRREDLDDLAGLDPSSPEFRQGLREHMVKRKELEELQEVARAATRVALEGYEPISEEWKKTLPLGILFDGEDRIFQLYVAREKPSDATVLTSARVNKATKAVSVTVTNLRPREP